MNLVKLLRWKRGGLGKIVLRVCNASYGIGVWLGCTLWLDKVKLHSRLWKKCDCEKSL